MADFSPPFLQTDPPSNRNKFPFPSPSLPPNYVTLQQLQERRLKQQQQREVKEEEEEEEEEEDRPRQREEAEEERKRHREAKEEEEERKKQLDLEKSLKSLETKPSDRSSRRTWGNRPKIAADKRGEIPTVEREIDGHGKSIERSNMKKIGKWREKTSPGERKTLTDGDPAHSLPENGKSAVDRKIAREKEDPETKGRKDAVEEDEGSNECGLGRRGEKMPATREENVEKEYKAVESAHKAEELEIVDCDEVDGKNAGRRSMEEKKLGDWRSRERRSFGQRSGYGYGRGFGYGRKKGGNAGAGYCDQTVEAVEGGKEVDEGLNERGLGRLGEKMPATGEDNVKKEVKAVEIAHKIEELEIIDCDEADGENAGSFGQRSRRSFSYRKKKGGNVEAHQTVEGGKEVEGGLNERSLGRPGEKMPATREENVEKDDKVVEIAHKIEELETVERERRNFGQRRRFGYGRGFGYGRSFGYQERRQPRHLTWVRKEENTNGSMRPV